MRAPLLFLILAATGMAAELHLDSSAVAANQPAALSLRLQSGDSQLTGVQFDVEFDASQFDLKVDLGPAAESAVKVIQTNTLQPGKERVLIFGFNRNKIADGVIAVAHLSLKSGADAGDAAQSFPIRISETTGTTAEGQAVKVAGFGANVTRGHATRARGSETR